MRRSPAAALLDSVDDPDRLFCATTDEGRYEGVVDWILAGDHTLLRAIPGGGKSTWLRCLRTTLSRRGDRVPVYLDALDPILADEGSFIRSFVGQLPTGHRRVRHDTFEELAMLVSDSGLQVVLLLDNFEGLFNRRRLVGPDPLAQFAPVRGVAQLGGVGGRKPLTVVLAGTSSVDQFSTRTGSPAFNFIIHDQVLGPLDPPATTALWYRLQAMHTELVGTELDVAHLHELTGGWPALIKKLAAHLCADVEEGRTGSYANGLFILDGSFERQWERLDQPARDALGAATRAAISDTPLGQPSAAVEGLHRLGLLDDELRPRGSRWLRFLARRDANVGGGTTPYIAAMRNRPPDLTEAAGRIATRVKRWVDGEVWLLNQLPQMVDHSAAHSSNVDHNAMRLMLHSDEVRGERSPAELYEVLSGAAWLHDVGHTGGYLADRVVTDFRHVRRFHGYFSRQTISSHSTELFPELWDAYTNERAIAAAVGLLAAHHQRHTLLVEGSYWSAGQAPKPVRVCAADTDCGPCGEAERAYRKTLRESILDDRLSGFFDVDELVAMAAVLRVADALDIGAHRVSRRIALGQWSAESFWHAHATSDLRDRLVTARRVADVLRWPELGGQAADLAEAASRVMRNPNPMACRKFADTLGKILSAYELTSDTDQVLLPPLHEALDEYERQIEFFADQARYRQLHLSFGSAQVYELDKGEFDVVLSFPVGSLPPNAPDALSDAALYIWTEYLGVEALMQRRGLSLNSVRGDRGGIGVLDRNWAIRELAAV